MQQHAAVVGQQVVVLLEEGGVALVPGVTGAVGEVLERAQRHDPVDRHVAGEFLPALDPHLFTAGAVHLVELGHAVGVLVLAQRQPDHVDVVLRHRVPHRRAPAAADVEQRHAGLEVQLVQRELALGVLRLFQRLGQILWVRVFVEVTAAVGHRRVKPQLEELVRLVVVRSHRLDRRVQLRSGFPL